VDWTRGFRRSGRHNVHSFAQISAFIPKNSLNLLSLVLIEILAERVATNVAANVQKTAGSMGIGMVHEEEIVVVRSFFRSRGTVLRRSYVVREKRSEKRSQTIATRSFFENDRYFKNLKDYHKKGQRQASGL
jgi:hypothetical protein